MSELALFKRYYELKKIIWLHGPEGSRQTQILQKLLTHCQVPMHRVARISPYQFIDMNKRGTIGSLVREYEALQIEDFEHLESISRELFFQSLLSYFQFKESFHFRILLVSSTHFSDEAKFQRELKPAIIRIQGIGEDPSDLNERIHAILECASRVTRKRVTRISARVASWLETRNWAAQDQELLAIFIFALRKMGPETTLKIRHLRAVNQILRENMLQISNKSPRTYLPK